MSHSILKQGTIDLQSFTGSQSKYACLCAPRTTQDLTTIYLELFKTTPKNMNFLGHLASSSINHTPLLILMSPKPSADNAVFIHFTTVKNFKDENQLKTGCSFQLTTLSTKYKFKCKTSITYQEWAHAVENGVRISKGLELVPDPDFNIFYKNQQSRVSFAKERVGMLTPGMSDDDEDIVGGRSVESVGKRVESKKVSWKTVEVVGGSPSTLKKGIDLKKGLYGDGAS